VGPSSKVERLRPLSAGTRRNSATPPASVHYPADHRPIRPPPSPRPPPHSRFSGVPLRSGHFRLAKQFCRWTALPQSSSGLLLTRLFPLPAPRSLIWIIAGESFRGSSQGRGRKSSDRPPRGWSLMRRSRRRGESPLPF
jgi:hypothetical protein